MERSTLGLFYRARSQARCRGKDFELSREEFNTLYNRCGGKCEVTGTPFNFERRINGRYPEYPSIDRIDSRGPYSLSNCRIVAQWVNVAMNNWGEDPIHDLVKRAQGAANLTAMVWLFAVSGSLYFWYAVYSVLFGGGDATTGN